ncbi:hypothetical protein D3C80_1666400 [compost metagenome]
MAELPGRNHMFPLDTLGALGIFTHLIATATEIGNTFLTLPVDLAATIKAAWGVLVDFGGSSLGLGKVINPLG